MAEYKVRISIRNSHFRYMCTVYYVLGGVNHMTLENGYFMTKWGAKRFARKTIKKHLNRHKPQAEEYEGTAEEILRKLK